VMVNKEGTYIKEIISPLVFSYNLGITPGPTTIFPTHAQSLVRSLTFGAHHVSCSTPRSPAPFPFLGHLRVGPLLDSSSSSDRPFAIAPRRAAGDLRSESSAPWDKFEAPMVSAMHLLVQPPSRFCRHEPSQSWADS
jgi:hypothetical protein